MLNLFEFRTFLPNPRETSIYVNRCPTVKEEIFPRGTLPYILLVDNQLQVDLDVAKILVPPLASPL